MKENILFTKSLVFCNILNALYRKKLLANAIRMENSLRASHGLRPTNKSSAHKQSLEWAAGVGGVHSVDFSGVVSIPRKPLTKVLENSHLAENQK
jgi:hypothetical protein